MPEMYGPCAWALLSNPGDHPMKVLISIAGLAFSTFAFAGFVQAAGEMVIPTDDVPFKVGLKDIVRRRSDGNNIPDSKIEATIERPARISRTSRVYERFDGVRVLANIKEFEIGPTGKCK